MDWRRACSVVADRIVADRRPKSGGRGSAPRPREMRYSAMVLPLQLLTAVAAAAPTKPTPVKICFELPSTYTGTVGVTVAVVDKENPDWIITHACYLNPFNVTKGKEQQGCISWDGIDENFWPGTLSHSLSLTHTHSLSLSLSLSVCKGWEV